MTRTPRESECDHSAPVEQYAPQTCKHGGRIRCQRCGTGASDTPHRTLGGRGAVARLHEKEGNQP